MCPCMYGNGVTLGVRVWQVFSGGVWLGAGVTALWEASYPFLCTDHQTKEKSARGQKKLSSPAHMIVLSSMTGPQQGPAVLTTSSSKLHYRRTKSYEKIVKLCADKFLRPVSPNGYRSLQHPTPSSDMPARLVQKV